jgi:hypothetical protein
VRGLLNILTERLVWPERPCCQHVEGNRSPPDIVIGLILLQAAASQGWLFLEHAAESVLSRPPRIAVSQDRHAEVVLGLVTPTGLARFVTTESDDIQGGGATRAPRVRVHFASIYRRVRALTIFSSRERST